MTITPYASLTEAATYFAERLHSAGWNEHSSADRTIALKMATRDIDGLAFAGDKADEDQAREFPRGDDTVAPDDIKIACAEIAFERLVNDVNPAEETADMVVLSEGHSGVRASYNPESVPEHIPAGIASAIAWRYLRPYLAERENVVVNRVS